MLRILVLGALSVGLAAPAVADHLDCSQVQAVPGTELRMELVARVAQPVDVTAVPGDASRLFIVEQSGRIRIVNLADGSLVEAPFLDIRGRVEAGGERGLLGLAFHPSYSENGELYVYYTARNSGASVISRFRVSAADPNAADADSEEILLTFAQPFSNHNGGQVRFGPLDGYLYIATGDGGSGGDPGDRAQNGSSLLGKMLRIDVDTTTGDLPYGIPADNPFLSNEAVRDEIWSVGLRNPWRFDFDDETGDLYIGDVGQGTWEEIDFVPAAGAGGENYEWRVREGAHNFNASGGYGVGTLVGPIFEYGHGTGRSVTGGVVYRGCRMPDLHGTYFFADYASHWVRSFRVVDGAMAELTDRTAQLNTDAPRAIRSISAFGEDARGEVYVCDHSFGNVYRLVPASVPPTTFKRGDGNGDKELNVSDVVFGLDQLFGGEQAGELSCLDSLDANDDGGVDVSDSAYTLNFLFGLGPAPEAPFAECGADPTEDALDCELSTCP
jgi:glucose/arabinose dehydrogenase